MTKHLKKLVGPLVSLFFLLNMTRKPQTKNRNVLKINPTSAETVDSA